METKATLKHTRTSARKIRLGMRFLKGMDVTEAEHQLSFSPKASSRIILKLLNSAVANAVNNHELLKDNLLIKDIIIDEGATLKRFRPRAFGRAGMIRKRSAHVTLILKEKKATAAKKEKKAIVKKPTDQKVVSYDELKKAEPEKEKTEFQEIKKEKSTGRFKMIKDKFTRRTGGK